MHILIITQHFPPEIEPSAQKIFEFAKSLITLGHRVDIITGFPNYPSGIIPYKYSGKFLTREIVDGVQVYRTYIVPSDRQIGLRRLISEISFMLSSFMFGILAATSDYVMSTIPPLGPGLVALLLCTIRHKPFLLEVRDPFMDGNKQEGPLVSRHMILQFASWIENCIYRGADHIFTISEGLKEILIMHRVPNSRISVIYSGSDPDLFNPERKHSAPPWSSILHNKFVVMYAGTIGISQRLETLIEAARILQNNDDIVFVVLGEGAEKEKIIRLCRHYGLDNVYFQNPRPRTDMPSCYATANVSVILLSNKPIHKCAIPTKTYDSMAMGKAIILSANSEANRIINQAQCGICIPPENSSKLAEAILYLYHNPDICRILGEKGRDFAVKNFSRQKVADKFCQVLKEVELKLYQ
jgi:glycosyltransferase involved in cell wall biosynthesis